MKLENQCSNLEQSKMLKQLGIIQESLFHHDSNDSICTKYDLATDLKSIASAFTCAELGVMLPDYYSSYREDNKLWYVGVEAGDNKFFGNTEAECRASLLIDLLENNVVTAEQVNNRLKD